ncbi:uncharacterized protein LOC113326464 [Papaver somniferum]|uniref:uncharacterized protein LOC113326464 n=1 Tax=Papaver somniferum TaxID=3469 RepID=UPI000E6F6188|nr:uncharacterized protein LOC113326464 [Papaver somniferum]
MIQMEVSTLPDKYLGVILKSGKVKIATVWPMVELMQNKLATWKGKLLSFNDRLVLIKSVLCSVPIYSMSIYKWPKSLIKICERIIRNFFWSGDSETRKHKILSWKKVCSPYNEGGLGIQRLEVINKALLMKILWRKINSKAEGALFIKAKFQDKHNQWKNNWQLSSIWLEEVGYTDYVKAHINMKVSDLILEGKWNVPERIKPVLSNYTLPKTGIEGDNLIWKGEIKGAAGFGIVIRDHLSQVLGVMSGGIGISTNYIAEVYAIISAVELAVEWKMQNAILNSDSKQLYLILQTTRCHGL